VIRKGRPDLVAVDQLGLRVGSVGVCLDARLSAQAKIAQNEQDDDDKPDKVDDLVHGIPIRLRPAPSPNARPSHSGSPSDATTCISALAQTVLGRR
jgi:hypothetical protein